MFIKCPTHFRLCVGWKRVVGFILRISELNELNHQHSMGDTFDDWRPERDSEERLLWRKRATFRRNMLPPSSRKSEPSIACYLIHSDVFLGVLWAFKVEATCSSETSSDFQRTTQYYIPKITTLQKNSFPCQESNSGPQLVTFPLSVVVLYQSLHNIHKWNMVILAILLSRILGIRAVSTYK
jgi:uncharacterized membrane protein